MPLEKGEPTMLTQLVFPGLAGVRVERVWREAGRVHIAATTTRRWASCPLCGRRSHRVHSRYVRTLADLPWCGTPVTIHLSSRRFRCRVRWCRRTIFTERLSALMAVSARRTARAGDHLVQMAFALGGEPGQRFARVSGLPVSARTLVRLMRCAPTTAGEPVEVLGVDDWSQCRGRTYGTLLVNLTTHRVIEVLPDRTAATFAAWLRSHPEVRIITRDRGGAYADGARQGAPQAQQIADRFHLLRNVTDAFQRYLARKHVALRHAACGALEEVAPPTLSVVQVSPAPEAVPVRSSRNARQSEACRARRYARYEEVIALRAQGHSIRAIARTTTLNKRTVLKFVHAEGFPELPPRPSRRSVLAPFEAYLRDRWAAGCHNAKQLWLDLRDHGFTGGHTVVAEYVKGWRRRPASLHTGQGGTAPRRPTLPCSPRHVCWLLLRPYQTLTAEEQAFLTRLYHACPQVALAEALTEEFAAVLRTRTVDGLYAWLRGVELSNIPEFCGVARGMWLDKAAVEAAVATDFSNGQLEGQVNRLKVIKRSAFGRCAFDLLRQRVLYDSAHRRQPRHQKRL